MRFIRVTTCCWANALQVRELLLLGRVGEQVARATVQARDGEGQGAPYVKFRGHVR